MSILRLLGSILSIGLLAAAPPEPGTRAWVLVLDQRGAVVGDLKPEEFQVKVDGKPQKPVRVKTPGETADASQSWILVFEPIRDTSMRALAFTAAADFLTRVPEGDRVMIVSRGKDSLESLMPGLSTRRGLWAEALAKVPELLPEAFLGVSKETLQGSGFRAGYADGPDGPAGQEALNALLARFKAAPSGWAGGTTDQRGVNVLDRINLNSPGVVAGMIGAATREAKALGWLMDQLSQVSGQKHLIVFSRCEADDLSHPNVKRAMNQPFKRERGDMGGPAEAAALATRDMTLLQAELKARAIAAGITLYSVAGAGQNVMGHVGSIAPATGGYAFPLTAGLEAQFGQGIQVFGSRYALEWQEGRAPGTALPLDVSTSRKGLKVLAQNHW